MYVEITQQSFESVLSELGKWEQIKDPFAKENIYILDGNIKIYSSIVNGVSRNCGRDAIRVVAWCSVSNLPIKSSEARVYRVETWTSNLKERILKVKSDIQSMKRCSTCGSFLIERENSTTHKKFWGCLNYKNHTLAKTINTITTNDKISPKNIEEITTTIDDAIIGYENKEIMASHTTFEPNKYQKDIFKFIKEGTGHAVIKASAGCAKTTSIVMGTKYISPGQKVLFLAFNKHIAIELQRRISNVDVRTFHSLGLSTIINTFGKVDVDPGKQRNILWEIVDKDVSFPKDAKYDVVSTACRICSLIKADMVVDVTSDIILDMIDYHNIELPINISNMTWIVKLAIDLSLKNKKVVDYDDMIYFPLVFNLPCRQYDYVFGDEAQDNNKSQTELMMRSVKPGGRVLAVGDPNQSCYGFRGADAEAIPSIITRLNASVLPLSITYRCPVSHVELANKLVPGLEARPNAPEGTIKYIDYVDFFDIVKQGDMVICRNNAPLVMPAFQLLGRGIKVVIKGRDIGENLVNIINKFTASDIDTFLSMLNEWRVAEVGKCARKNISPDMINDKYEVLNILSDGCKDVQCIINKIKTIFSDENAAILFSSIHRAKGLESNTVFILEPQLMPSRHAKTDWELVQEKNIQYIAVTRSRDKMYFVSEDGDTGLCLD